MLAAALLTVISFHNLFVGTMLCFLVSAAPAGLLAISLAVSAAGSMVIVNTVVLVKARFGLGEIEVAWRWRFGSANITSWLSLLAALPVPLPMAQSRSRKPLLQC